jgi:RNA polymerase sigma-70 factor (ECF subfamily)
MMPFVPWRPAPRRTAARAAAPVAELLAAVAQGDAAALAEIYRREAQAVYRYTFGLCGNAGWAADATQEAFVVLATRPLGFDATRGSLGAYLAGVARHALAATWRAVKAEDPLHDTWAQDGAADQEDAAADHPHAGRAASPEDLLVRAQSGQQVWAALRQLPAPFREALVLVDLQERPYAEAARIAGIELNTLRTRLHRARLKLAALLDAGTGDCHD